MKLFKKRQKEQSRRSATNTTPNVVRSYYSGKVETLPQERTNSNRLPGKPTNSIFRRMGWAGIVVLVLVAIFVMLGVNKHSSVSINNPELLFRKQSDYQSSVDLWLRDTPFRKWKPLVNTTALDKKLKADFPEVDSAKIALPLLGQRLSVRINLSPIALKLNTPSGAFLVTNKGKIINWSNQAPSLPLLEDQNAITTSDNRAISSEIVDYIVALNTTLKSGGLQISKYTRTDDGYDINVSLDGKPYQIKTNIFADPIEQGSRALTYLKSGSEEPKTYLDVRVPQKVYSL